MKNIKPLLLLPALAMVIASCENRAERGAQNYNEKTELDNQALTFVKMGNESGLAEIKASTLAQSKSQNPRVLSFAKMMVSDHTQAGHEIMAITKDKQVTEGSAVSEQHQKTIDSLGKLSGADFDKGYMTMMVKDHEAAIKLFEDASTNRIEPVQKMAKKTLPALKMHLDSANAIRSSLK